MRKEIETTGVMFTDLPTLRSVADYSNRVSLYNFDLPDEILDWHVVAYNPNTIGYYDDSQEAMDVTNYDVVRGYFPAYIPTLESTGYGSSYMMHGIDEALEARVAFIDKVLIIAPDHEMSDEMRDLVRQLADYPLLDESGYSALEWEAWLKYGPIAFEDELRGAGRKNRYDEALLEALSERSEAILPQLSQHLHYEYGFSGEYGPDFLDTLDDLMGKYDPEICKLLPEFVDVPASVQSAQDPNQPEIFENS